MATFDVVIDDEAVMFIQPALANTSAQWDAFPAGKAMSRVLSLTSLNSETEFVRRFHLDITNYLQNSNNESSLM